MLIVDIGGGTSDFSIVRVSPERAGKPDRKDDVLANAGVHIGGTDFDRLLSLSEVMPHFGYRTWTQDRKRESADALLPRPRDLAIHQLALHRQGDERAQADTLRGGAA